MKTRSAAASADSLIQYLNLHTPILTEQGINVRAFIDRLSALKQRATNSSPEKPKGRKKRETCNE